MSPPKRLVVVDDDAKVRRLLEHALRPPEFETFAFQSGAEALRLLPQVRPACIVSDILMPDLDGESLLRAFRAVPGLESVPFIAVSAVRSETRIRAVLSAGANAFLLKPFPVRDLVEKIRDLIARPHAHEPSTATWGAIARPPGLAAAASAVTAAAAAAATASAAAAVAAGAAAPARTQPVPGDGAQRTEVQPQDPVLGFGRFTKVETGGRSFVVLTEAAARPRFTVTTVITEKGVALRKIETALPYPLAREDDQETARRQLDQQHDDTIARLPRLVVDAMPRRVIWSDQSRGVDPDLLAWTVSAVAQHAEAEVGTAETVRALRRTRQRLAVQEDTLASFYVTELGRVITDPFLEGPLPRRAIGAAAAWCSAFALEALDVREDRLADPIQRATHRRSAELERLGFYAKLRGKVGA